MKQALTLRAALDELMPEALYRLPPEETPRGIEEAVQVSHAVPNRLAPTALANDEGEEEFGHVRELEEMFEFGPDAADTKPALGDAEGERIRQAVLAAC